jgi:hypothetical protein
VIQVFNVPLYGSLLPECLNAAGNAPAPGLGLSLMAHLRQVGYWDRSRPSGRPKGSA